MDRRDDGFVCMGALWKDGRYHIYSGLLGALKLELCF